MPKDDHIYMDAFVTDVHAGGQFEVELESGQTSRCRLAGAMRKNKIRVILGDKVKIAYSPYDMSHGRIVQRYK